MPKVEAIATMVDSKRLAFMVSKIHDSLRRATGCRPGRHFLRHFLWSAEKLTGLLLGHLEEVVGILDAPEIAAAFHIGAVLSNIGGDGLASLRRSNGDRKPKVLEHVFYWSGPVSNVLLWNLEAFDIARLGLVPKLPVVAELSCAIQDRHSR